MNTQKLDRLRSRMITLMTNENISIEPKGAKLNQRVNIKYSPELRQAIDEYENAKEKKLGGKEKVWISPTMRKNLKALGRALAKEMRKG